MEQPTTNNQSNNYTTTSTTTSTMAISKQRPTTSIAIATATATSNTTTYHGTMAEQPLLVDAHVHLFPTSELGTITWVHPGHPLYARHSVTEYLAASSSSRSPHGFIFVEVDRKQDLTPVSGWEFPLLEIAWLARIALGTPNPDEGHEPGHRSLVLGIVPWAPVPAGAESLADYIGNARERAGDSWELVKGFRYLLQDKPRGVMLEEGFIEGLKWLGVKGFRFDLGIDQRSGGTWQLEDAARMLKMAYEGVTNEKKVIVIIDHLCKPNLHIPTNEATKHPDFLAWKDHIQTLASFSTTYMKLSGLFSELPAQDPSKPIPVAQVVAQVRPWVDTAFDAFGSGRIIFGSDWPVCNIGGGGGQKAWKGWRDVVEQLLDEIELSEKEKLGVWGGNALMAYGISGEPRN
ncbi:hypothetical protein FGG08_007398 [Glutinoglossum americanum]|uniref:Amidohydrolase-related domain-containing protein n=1 Tax=Glutinoglossum americanum TaxID=1670608 RepID=A0A9P8KWG8_9PEZI|nr:hypothetical protein FGG08_007398 [Glutinoglossum americanum]